MQDSLLRESDGKLSCVTKQSNKRKKGLVRLSRRTGDVRKCLQCQQQTNKKKVLREGERETQSGGEKWSQAICQINHFSHYFF